MFLLIKSCRWKNKAGRVLVTSLSNGISVPLYFFKLIGIIMTVITCSHIANLTGHNWHGISACHGLRLWNHLCFERKNSLIPGWGAVVSKITTMPKQKCPEYQTALLSSKT